MTASRSIYSDADLDLDTEEEKEEAKKLDEENKDMFTFMQEAIADKVKTVRLSKKLKLTLFVFRQTAV